MTSWLLYPIGILKFLWAICSRSYVIPCFITIFDANGNILYTRHRQGVQNLLSKDESKKSLEMAMDSWKVREGLSNKIGRGMYVLAEYEKIKRLTMPFGDDLILYLTTEVEADHSNIYDRIRRLEAGLKY